MELEIEPFAKLVEAFTRLPSIGPKTAQRLVFHILKTSQAEVDQLAKAIVSAKQEIRTCSICHNMTDKDPCRLCENPRREKNLICLVADPRDVMAMERSREYRGVYHVLGGLISPMDGIGPEQLNIESLLNRLKKENITEIIIALNSGVTGEVTAMYLARLLKPLGIHVTRLAFGLPVGADLEYADELTLAKAVEGRLAYNI